MKQGTIKYSQEFISPTGLKRWIGLEYPLDWETDDPQFILNYLKNMAEAGYSALNAEMEGELAVIPGRIPDQDLPKETRIALLIADIYSCKEYTVLESYRLMVKRNPELEAAYEEMRIKLIGKETKEILRKTDELCTTSAKH